MCCVMLIGTMQLVVLQGMFLSGDDKGVLQMCLLLDNGSLEKRDLNGVDHEFVGFKQCQLFSRASQRRAQNRK